MADKPTPNEQPTETVLTEVSQAEILQRLQELEQANHFWRQEAMRVNAQPNTFGQYNGQLVGTVTKYNVDPAAYPDPRERLAKEDRLKRFAFNENYELDWLVSISSYQTKDNVNMQEPKFTLELHRIVMDEDTGEPTTGRYVVCRAIFHEDPQAALVVARENGVEINQEDEPAFLNEMRYLRMRDWLLEAFYPPKPTDGKTKRDMVIDGRLVEFFEISGEKSQSIPFKDLSSKF